MVNYEYFKKLNKWQFIDFLSKYIYLLPVQNGDRRKGPNSVGYGDVIKVKGLF